MRRSMEKDGFTLIELIMVILILGILAVTALPRFFNLQNNALDAAELGVVGAVRAGIATDHANRVAGGGTGFIADLDGASVGACTTANPCFDDVLDQGGITGDRWSKATDVVNDTYTHDGTNLSTYTYTPATGQFVCTATCP